MNIRFTKRSLRVSIIAIMVTGLLNVHGQNVGEAGPDFEVNLLGGQTFKLSEQQGKVVFVFLFGNGCPNCKAIGPTVETSIYQKYIGNSNFTAVGVDTWNSSSSETSVTSFKTTTGITFPLAVKAGDVATAYSTTYDRLMVIDQNGILVHKGVTATKNDIDNAIEAIDVSLIVAGGLDDNQGVGGVRLYPVPAKDIVYFDAAEPVTGFRMFDLTGKLMLEEVYGPASVTSNSVSLESVESGVYFYILQQEGSQSTGKLVIQR